MFNAARTKSNIFLHPLKRNANKNLFFRSNIKNNAKSFYSYATNQAAKNNAPILLAVLSAGCVMTISSLHFHQAETANKICCDSSRPLGGDIVMLEPTKEPSTGILFPRLCNALTFVGCGVRVKWRFVKVYAVGTYIDPIALTGIQKDDIKSIQKALLDPMYPRSIRIVMNRSLSIDKFTAGIMESLEPRMKGEDLDKLEEFKNLNPKVDLLEGSEMEMTIRGDTMLFKNAMGVVGVIRSQVFCDAMCDVYYGDDPVSPGHKDDVIKGIQALL